MVVRGVFPIVIIIPVTVVMVIVVGVVMPAILMGIRYAGAESYHQQANGKEGQHYLFHAHGV